MGRERICCQSSLSVCLSVCRFCKLRQGCSRKEGNKHSKAQEAEELRALCYAQSKDAPRPRLLVARQAGRQPASYKQGSFCCVGMACESELPGLALPRLWFTLDFCRHLGCLPWQAGKLNGMGLRGFSLKTGICCNTRRPLDAAPATSLARTALGAFS